VLDDRQSRGREDQLHERLVHHHGRRRDTRSDVPHVGQLQQPLDRPILAERPVQQRKHDIHRTELVRRPARLEDGQRPLR